MSNTYRCPKCGHTLVMFVKAKCVQHGTCRMRKQRESAPIMVLIKEDESSEAQDQ